VTALSAASESGGSGHQLESRNWTGSFSKRTASILLIITAGLLAGVGAFFGITVTALAYAVFVTVGVALSAIDLKHRILPNRIVLPATVVGLVVLAAAATVDGRELGNGHVAEQILRTILGGVALFGVYLVLALVSPNGMGMGDVKFAGFVGMFLAFDGWRTLLAGAAASFVLAALVGALLLLVRRADRTSTIPFGPLMYLGAILALAWGEQAVNIT
jgi:leader peptidase (prepilin peptidase)/N-methyltransferase